MIHEAQQIPANKIWQSIEANKNKRYGFHYNFDRMTQLLRLGVNEWMSKNQYPDNDAKRVHLAGMEAAKDYLASKGVAL